MAAEASRAQWLFHSPGTRAHGNTGVADGGALDGLIIASHITSPWNEQKAAPCFATATTMNRGSLGKEVAVFLVVRFLYADEDPSAVVADGFWVQTGKAVESWFRKKLKGSPVPLASDGRGVWINTFWPDYVALKQLDFSIKLVFRNGDAAVDDLEDGHAYSLDGVLKRAAIPGRVALVRCGSRVELETALGEAFGRFVPSCGLQPATPSFVSVSRDIFLHPTAGNPVLLGAQPGGPVHVVTFSHEGTDGILMLEWSGDRALTLEYYFEDVEDVERLLVVSAWRVAELPSDRRGRARKRKRNKGFLLIMTHNDSDDKGSNRISYCLETKLLEIRLGVAYYGENLNFVKGYSPPEPDVGEAGHVFDIVTRAYRAPGVLPVSTLARARAAMRSERKLKNNVSGLKKY
jgi:hypothetical protein